MVQQVGNRMVGLNGVTVFLVDAETCKSTFSDAAVQHFADMNPEAVEFLFGVGHLNLKAIADNGSDVADLAAHLAVKRRLVGKQVKFAGAGFRDFLTVLNQSGNFGVGSERIVAQKFGRTEFVLKFKPDFVGACISGTCPVSAGFGTLFFHGLVKAAGIDADIFGLEGVLRQVKRKSVSIVQFECGSTRKFISFFKILRFIVQQAEAFVQRAQKSGFFGFDGV